MAALAERFRHVLALLLHVAARVSQHGLEPFSGVPVLAGPVEAATLGNVLVEARTLGDDLPDPEAMRALIASTQHLERYRPSESGRPWEVAVARIHTDDKAR